MSKHFQHHLYYVIVVCTSAAVLVLYRRNQERLRPPYALCKHYMCWPIWRLVMQCVKQALQHTTKCAKQTPMLQKAATERMLCENTDVMLCCSRHAHKLCSTNSQLGLATCMSALGVCCVLLTRGHTNGTHCSGSIPCFCHSLAHRTLLAAD